MRKGRKIAVITKRSRKEIKEHFIGEVLGVLTNPSGKVYRVRVRTPWGKSSAWYPSSQVMTPTQLKKELENV